MGRLGVKNGEKKKKKVFGFMLRFRRTVFAIIAILSGILIV